MGHGGAGEEWWEEGMPGRPFIGSEGERGHRASEGNGQWRWCTIMVVEVAVSGGDRPEWWWGAIRGGARSVTGAKGLPRGGDARACEAVMAGSVGLGRKMTGRGPRVCERGRLAG
jgi:hypothetical protein